jgi:hypothetical protein
LFAPSYFKERDAPKKRKTGGNVVSDEFGHDDLFVDFASRLFRPLARTKEAAKQASRSKAINLPWQQQKQRGQATLCHTKPFADRCFLPDLAGLSNVLLHRT